MELLRILAQNQLFGLMPVRMAIALVVLNFTLYFLRDHLTNYSTGGQTIGRFKAS